MAQPFTSNGFFAQFLLFLNRVERIKQFDAIIASIRYLINQFVSLRVNGFFNFFNQLLSLFQRIDKQNNSLLNALFMCLGTGWALGFSADKRAFDGTFGIQTQSLRFAS